MQPRIAYKYAAGIHRQSLSFFTIQSIVRDDGAVLLPSKLRVLDQCYIRQ